MADNDRFVIIRENELIITSSDIYQIKQLDKFIKTRAEYEDIIFQLAKQAVTAEGLAKDICDRLFGEGE